MNIYEDEMLEKKLNEISNQMGHLVMDILLLSLKRLGNQSGVQRFYGGEDGDRPEKRSILNTRSGGG